MLDKFFGASWGTSLLGYLIAALMELEQYAKSGQVWPDTWPDRIQVVTGLLIAVLGRITKQANITNAAKPVESQKVPADAPPAF